MRLHLVVVGLFTSVCLLSCPGGSGAGDPNVGAETVDGSNALPEVGSETAARACGAGACQQGCGEHLPEEGGCQADGGVRGDSNRERDQRDAGWAAGWLP